MTAEHILRDRYGLNFPTDGITISTVGPVDQLKKLREEHLKIQLTISLHAATQSARNRIIPHMRIYAIEDVVKQALSYSERHNRKIVFAYLLLPGINDRPSDVRQLAKWFRGKKVMSCRLVRLNMTFVLTRLRSFGTGTNAIDCFLLSESNTAFDLVAPNVPAFGRLTGK